MLNIFNNATDNLLHHIAVKLALRLPWLAMSHNPYPYTSVIIREPDSQVALISIRIFSLNKVTLTHWKNDRLQKDYTVPLADPDYINKIVEIIGTVHPVPWYHRPYFEI